MAENINQHWLPKYYFRSFTEGKEFIHILHRNNGKIDFDTRIKKQCSRSNFYGSIEIEKKFSLIESEHAAVIRRLKKIGWSPSEPPLNQNEIKTLLEAVLFQRGRTDLQIKKEEPTRQDLYLHVFREFVQSDPSLKNHRELLKSIEDGCIHFDENPHDIVLESIQTHIKNAHLISDLRMCLLLNKTDNPFIFSDSPVIFYNTYYRNVINHGVLGFQTPGLQIFMPIDSKTCLMLIDSKTYSGRYMESHLVSIDDVSDVSHLNILQLHHGVNGVYFSDRGSAEYVHNLWKSHSQKINDKPLSQFHTRNGWTIDGKRIEQIIQEFEPHIDHFLKLSFVECDPIDAIEYKFRRR